MSEASTGEAQAAELIQQARQQYLDSVEEEIESICSNLEQIDERLVTERSKSLVHELDGCDMSGQTPNGLAAGAVYLSTLLLNEQVSQYEISNSANVSKVTIRSQYQNITEWIGGV
jgi:transcription initiation factor TFIIB